ncbi:MAG TPA: radical SAM protein, partial [Candidatus Ozemobacteraceae bacterium]
MKILLVNPPVSDAMGDLRLLSIGLCHLARIAEDAGHRVEILDAGIRGMTADRLIAWVQARGGFDIIGVTITTPALPSATQFARGVRSSTRWLIEGGAHISAMVREGGREPSPGFDIAFPGEADRSFAAFLPWAASAAPGQLPPAGIRDGMLISGCPFRPAPPLPGECISRPAWHLLDPAGSSYPLAFGRPAMPMFTSRGCPFSCLFCDHSVFGHTVRYYPLESLQADLEEVASRGVRYVIFFDDHFSLDHERLRAICQFLIQKNLGLAWKCEGRAGSFTPELLRLMRRAGCECIAMGIESGNQPSLDFLRKGTTIAQIREAASMIRASGIRLLGYFILGIPGETWRQAMHTVAFAHEIGCDYAQFSLLSPYPGTPLAALARKRGWLAESRQGNPYDALAPRPVIAAPPWTPERLERLIRAAHLKFYASPAYLLRRLR